MSVPTKAQDGQVARLAAGASALASADALAAHNEEDVELMKFLQSRSARTLSQRS